MPASPSCRRSDDRRDAYFFRAQASAPSHPSGTRARSLEPLSRRPVVLLALLVLARNIEFPAAACARARTRRYAKPIPLEAGVDLETIARATPGFSGAPERSPAPLGDRPSLATASYTSIL
eukprot:3664540-Pleurochrysis_carterae.AAC.3